jgi:hypothetical protein
VAINVEPAAAGSSAAITTPQSARRSPPWSAAVEQATDELAALFWPAAVDERSAANVRKALHLARGGRRMPRRPLGAATSRCASRVPWTCS